MIRIGFAPPIDRSIRAWYCRMDALLKSDANPSKPNGSTGPCISTSIRRVRVVALGLSLLVLSSWEVPATLFVGHLGLQPQHT